MKSLLALTFLLAFVATLAVTLACALRHQPESVALGFLSFALAVVAAVCGFAVLEDR